MKNALRTFSIVLVVASSLSVYGYLVMKHASPHADNPLVRALHQFASFPGTVLEVLESKEIRNIPPTFEATLVSDTFNRLENDVFGLMSLYNREANIWEIRLTNFKTDSVCHKWRLTKDHFNHTDREWANSEPRNPILLSNRHLITNNDESKNLYRLDAVSEIIWHNTEKKFHHSLNLDHEGNIWVCSTELKRIKVPQAEEAVPYEDNFITKVDTKTGQILHHKSTSEIFIENGYRNYVYGFANGTHNRLEQDPLHLNDIEPVLKDGPFWKQGDVFLSFRNRSTILLYRPSSNKIIRFIQGVFLKQHDVDILNDSTISIFNNEGTNVGTKHLPKWQWDRIKTTDTITNSNIVRYHFADSTFSFHFRKHFDEHGIFSEYQGFHHTLPNEMVYIEEHTDGLQYFMTETEVVYKKQLPNRLDTLVENPHWVRLYENIDF